MSNFAKHQAHDRGIVRAFRSNNFLCNFHIINKFNLCKKKTLLKTILRKCFFSGQGSRVHSNKGEKFIISNSQFLKNGYSGTEKKVGGCQKKKVTRKKFKLLSDCLTLLFLGRKPKVPTNQKTSLISSFFFQLHFKEFLTS